MKILYFYGIILFGFVTKVLCETPESWKPLISEKSILLREDYSTKESAEKLRPKIDSLLQRMRDFKKTLKLSEDRNEFNDHLIELEKRRNSCTCKIDGTVCPQPRDTAFYACSCKVVDYITDTKGSLFEKKILSQPDWEKKLLFLNKLANCFTVFGANETNLRLSDSLLQQLFIYKNGTIAPTIKRMLQDTGLANSFKTLELGKSDFNNLSKLIAELIKAGKNIESITALIRKIAQESDTVIVNSMFTGLAQEFNDKPSTLILFLQDQTTVGIVSRLIAEVIKTGQMQDSIPAIARAISESKDPAGAIQVVKTILNEISKKPDVVDSIFLDSANLSHFGSILADVLHWGQGTDSLVSFMQILHQHVDQKTIVALFSSIAQNMIEDRELIRWLEWQVEFGDRKPSEKGLNAIMDLYKVIRNEEFIQKLLKSVVQQIPSDTNIEKMSTAIDRIAKEMNIGDDKVELFRQIDSLARSASILYNRYQEKGSRLRIYMPTPVRTGDLNPFIPQDFIPSVIEVMSKSFSEKYMLIDDKYDSAIVSDSLAIGKKWDKTYLTSNCDLILNCTYFYSNATSNVVNLEVALIDAQSKFVLHIQTDTIHVIEEKDTFKDALRSSADNLCTSITNNLLALHQFILFSDSKIVDRYNLQQFKAFLAFGNPFAVYPDSGYAKYVGDTVTSIYLDPDVFGSQKSAKKYSIFRTDFLKGLENEFKDGFLPVKADKFTEDNLYIVVDTVMDKENVLKIQISRGHVSVMNVVISLIDSGGIVSEKSTSDASKSVCKIIRGFVGNRIVSSCPKCPDCPKRCDSISQPPISTAIPAFFPAGLSQLIFNKQLNENHGWPQGLRIPLGITLTAGQIFCMMAALRYDYLATRNTNRLSSDEINEKYIPYKYGFFFGAIGCGLAGSICFAFDNHTLSRIFKK